MAGRGVHFTSNDLTCIDGKRWSNKGVRERERRMRRRRGGGVQVEELARLMVAYLIRSAFGIHFLLAVMTLQTRPLRPAVIRSANGMDETLRVRY